MNSARVAYGLRPLRVDDRLERAARSHSSSMMHTNAFTHGSFLARVRSFGARGPVLGENLAWGTGGFAAPAEIVREWLASPEHRANLLRPGYRRVGIGIMQGSFQGYPGALIATADFGGR